MRGWMCLGSGGQREGDAHKSLLPAGGGGTHLGVEAGRTSRSF